MTSANGWYPGVKLLIDRGMKSSLVDYTGRSPLHLAARFGNNTQTINPILYLFTMNPFRPCIYT